MWCNKYWATFTNWTLSRQVKSGIDENHHQNPENTARREITLWIRMNQKIFDPLICGASISEQHLQTELCQDKWYQLGIKNPQQNPETLIGAKKWMYSNATKCICFLYMRCIKFWATFKHRIASRQEKSSIDENLTKIQKHWSELSNGCIPSNKCFRVPICVVHQFLSNFLTQNCVKTGEIKYWQKPSPKPRNTDPS